MSEYSNSSKETMRVGSRAKSTRSRKSTKGKPDLDSCSTNAGILCESTNK